MSEGRIHFVPAIWPVDLNTGANAGDYISLKGYNRVKCYITVNDTAGTCVVTAFQATDVAATGQKALGFTTARKTGGRLDLTAATGVYSVGETITGAATGNAVVVEASRNSVTYHTKDATAFVDGELVTGGTSGYTALADGTSYDEDILCKVAVSENTFTIPDVHNKVYMVEWSAAELDVDNKFDCMKIHLAQASGSGIGDAVYILEEPMFSEDPMPSAIYD